MKHRYLFGLLIGLVCFCIFLFYVTYSEVEEKTIADFNSRQLVHARQAGKGIEQYFSDLIIFLTKLSESGHVIVLDEQGKNEMNFALRTSRQEIKAITRVDATGRIHYTLPYDGTTIGRDISYQKHIREIMNIRKPVVSDVFTAVQGYNAIALHVPVLKGNEYCGTLAVLIDFRSISKRFLEDIRIGETGYAWVTSREGIELYCPVPGHTGKSVFENRKDFPSIIAMAKEMVKGHHGVTIYSDDQIRDRKTETVSKYAIYLPVKIGNTFWTIVVASSKDEVLASLESFRNKLIFIIGLLFLGGAVFSFYGMRASGIIREEAKRQKIEEALRDSEARYRDLVENATDLICTHDLKGTLLSVNATAAKVGGFKVEEVTGLCLTDLMPEDRRQEFNDYIGTIRRDRAAGGIMKIMTHNGERYWEYRSSLRTEGVPVPVVRSIARDVTGEVLAKRALKKSEKRYRLLFERNLAGVYRTTLDGRIIDCNDAFARIYGYESRGEAMQHPAVDLYPSLKARQEFIDTLQERGMLLAFESQKHRKDGSWIWLLENASLVPGEDGELTEIEGMLIDITERKKAEEELAQIFSRSLGMICIADINTATFLKVNPAFTDTLGYSEKELLGKSFLEFIHSEDIGPTNEVLREKLSKGEKAINFENRYTCKDGSYKWLNWLSHPIPEKGITYAVAQDVTELKLTEKALRESEEKYRLTFNTSPDSVNINRLRDGIYMDINDGFTKLTGFTRDDVIGKTSHEINIWDDPADRQKLVQGLREKGYYENLEACFRRKDGSIVTGLMSARVISMNGIPHIISITRDITDRKKIEEELLKADKLESIGILAGGIAHDFNNMLTSIVGNISLAMIHVKPGSKAFDLLNAAETTAMKASGITGRLLTFAKGGAPVKKTLSIQNLIKESSLFVLQDSKSECEFQIAEDLWPVDADMGQISQVISNILINANQAMPDGGIIRITAENLMPEKTNEIPVEHGRYICISIKDQGVGIDEKHLSKIFDPYFTTKEEGSGLGLAAAHSIIKNHNGHISVDSLPGTETTFHIYLPASDREIPVKEEATLLKGRGKILVMDDDRMLREMAKEMLEILGYEPEFAIDGAEAVEMYRKAMESGKPYDAVILDLSIPGSMGGKEAVKILIKMDPEVKAVVFSGYSDDPVMSNYSEYGFKGMMTKPFEFKTLSRVLNEVLKAEDRM